MDSGVCGWLVWLFGALVIACGHAAPARWTVVPAGTSKNLIDIGCTEAGDVYAIDDAGEVHDLRGHPSRPSNDAERSAASHFEQPSAVAYGTSRIEAVARGAGHAYALGRYMAISNSLENDFAYLIRSDDGGATWAEVWTGPDRGPMGMGQRSVPDVGAALAVLPGGGVVLAASDGAVLISTDLGKTFVRHATAATAALAGLWAGSTGVLYGVGKRGEIVISSDGGHSFETTHEGDTDLVAVTGCNADVWIAGARGTVLAR